MWVFNIVIFFNFYPVVLTRHFPQTPRIKVLGYTTTMVTYIEKKANARLYGKRQGHGWYIVLNCFVSWKLNKNKKRLNVGGIWPTRKLAYEILIPFNGFMKLLSLKNSISTGKFKSYFKLKNPVGLRPAGQSISYSIPSCSLPPAYQYENNIYHLLHVACKLSKCFTTNFSKERFNNIDTWYLIAKNYYANKTFPTVDIRILYMRYGKQLFIAENYVPLLGNKNYINKPFGSADNEVFNSLYPLR